MNRYSQKEVKGELEDTSLQVNSLYVHSTFCYFTALEGLLQSDHLCVWQICCHELLLEKLCLVLNRRQRERHWDCGVVMASLEGLREFFWTARRKNSGVGKAEADFLCLSNMCGGGGGRLGGIYDPGLTENSVHSSKCSLSCWRKKGWGIPHRRRQQGTDSNLQWMDVSIQLLRSNWIFEKRFMIRAQQFWHTAIKL